MAKRLARLAAVQALYRNAFEQEPLRKIMADSDFDSWRDEGDEVFTQAVDASLFGAIVEGVAAESASLDDMIGGALDAKVSAARMEILLRTILRAGAYELYRHADVPAGVIINDYVDVAHAFFDGKEPGLVNGVLDKLASKLRTP